MVKICTQCKNGKDESFFAKNKTSNDGYNNWCKDCFKNWRRANRLKILKYGNEYRKENREKLLKLNSDRYYNNRELILKQQKEKRNQNIENFNAERRKKYNPAKQREVYKKIKEKIKTWQNKNRHKMYASTAKYRKSLKYVLVNKSHCQNRRALKKKFKGKITKQHLEGQYVIQEGKCYYCSNPILKEKMTVDHYIPLSKGGLHDDSNIVLACNFCNCSKKDKMPEIFIGQNKKQVA